MAATAVVLYHASRHIDKNYGIPMLKAIFQFGHAGVDLFFVLSGFIILFVHYDDVGQPEQILRYSERRLTRVLPTYWIAVLVTVAMAWAGNHGTPLADVGWAILPLPISTESVLGVAWTLQYEFVFYAAFAILILNRAAGIAVMTIWLVAVAIGACWSERIALPWAYWGIFNLEFFVGMVVAHRLRQRSFRHYKFALAAGISMFIATSLCEDVGWIDGYGVFARIVYGLPAALIVLSAAEASRQSPLRVPAILSTLGAASYSIYLFHFALIGLLWQVWLATGLDKTIPPTISFLVFSIGAIIGGIAMSRSVEYPLMRAIRRNFARPWSRKVGNAGTNVSY